MVDGAFKLTLSCHIPMFMGICEFRASKSSILNLALQYPLLGSMVSGSKKQSLAELGMGGQDRHWRIPPIVRRGRNACGSGFQLPGPGFTDNKYKDKIISIFKMATQSIMPRVNSSTEQEVMGNNTGPIEPTEGRCCMDMRFELEGGREEHLWNF